ncbi:hypothetical protein MMC14_000230 [Varicellaria rhodocarpa]|nr:hypothetical protein [Varicellaria rhodocarpa]
MSLWQSYRNLQPRTRLFLGLGLISWAGAGLLITEQAEKKFDLVPTDKDREELDEAVPKIRIVDSTGR